MTAHTAGPWHVIPGVYDTNPETASEFPHGPEVHGPHGVIAFCQLHGEHDAQLIAAAPDLLHALRGAAGYLRNAHIDLSTGAPKRTAMMTITGGIKLVEAAIAKAEGAV